MLKKHATLISVLRSTVDVAGISIVWLGAYFVRFDMGLFPAPKGASSFANHLMLLPPIVLLCYLSCAWAGLYKPQRATRSFRLIANAAKACALSLPLVLSFLYYAQERPYSRILVLIFFVGLLIELTCSHFIVMSALRYFRSRGYNLRYFAMIGTSGRAMQLAQEIEATSWYGLRCAFFVNPEAGDSDYKLMGIPVCTDLNQLEEAADRYDIQEIYLAVTGPKAREIHKYLVNLQAAGITVRIVPEWDDLITFGAPTTQQIGSHLLISIADPHLNEVGYFTKTVFDKLIALLAIIMLSLPMLLIGIVVKITSPGRAIYSQKRVGADNRDFTIYKFRTMKNDQLEDNGRWTSPDDPRCTRFGAWLRRTSLDELPQLFNVLKGDMSLVGPRPERPCLVKQFSEEYRRYMLRHKVKAGMTGWAQIHGFRGDTSLRKRLVYDLYYVRNWSFWLDLWILLRTPLHILKKENAY